jgi:hypothetical protein
MRRLFLYTASLLIYLMTPGTGELTADLLHFAQTGHSEHASPADGHTEEETPEHPCSGPYHVCHCHHALCFLLAPVPRVTAVAPPASGPALWSHRQEPKEGTRDPLFRPPIA